MRSMGPSVETDLRIISFCYSFLFVDDLPSVPETKPFRSKKSSLIIEKEPMLCAQESCAQTRNEKFSMNS